MSLFDQDDGARVVGAEADEAAVYLLLDERLDQLGQSRDDEVVAKVDENAIARPYQDFLCVQGLVVVEHADGGEGVGERALYVRAVAREDLARLLRGLDGLQEVGMLDGYVGRDDLREADRVVAP